MVEHVLGKDEVGGSNPLLGFRLEKAVVRNASLIKNLIVKIWLPNNM